MFTRVKGDFFGSLSIFLLLMVFWLLISASIDWQHILVGAIFSSILTVFWSNLTISEKFKTEFTAKQLFLFVKYMILLTIEIISANITVAMIVLNPKMPISPGMVIMRCDLERSLLRVLYVNSITLCPGTIAVELEGNLLIVHAFTRHYGQEQGNSPQYKRLLEMEAVYRNDRNSAL